MCAKKQLERTILYKTNELLMSSNKNAPFEIFKERCTVLEHQLSLILQLFLNL